MNQPDRMGHINARDYDLIAQNALFCGVNFGSVEYMLEYSFIMDLAVGERLLQPAQANQHLYLILEGTLNVHLLPSEATVHTTLAAGDCAGEISLVDGKPPTALVVAATPCRVLAVPQFTVWSLVTYSHEISRNLLEILAGRIRHDKVTLIETQNKKSLFEHQACVDALTGIYNRHWMQQGFLRALNRSAFEKKPFAIMMVDIDHFKQVNDTHGHLVGDLALKFISKRITEGLRPYDLLVRYGGEEFAVFLYDADTEQAQMVAERLRQHVAETKISYQQLLFKVTVSIGIAPTSYEASLEELIGQADQALYQAKRAGRNRVELYGKELCQVANV